MDDAAGDRAVIEWRRVTRFGVPEVFALIGLLSFLVALLAPVLSIPLVCPMKAAFGVPCATCGMTHAFVALAHGNVGAAFGASPFGALLAAGVWLYTGVDFARAALDLPFPFLELKLQRALAAIAAVALAANWAWLLTHGSTT